MVTPGLADKQRARTHAEKDARRQAIVSAATQQLTGETTLDQVTISAVARAAGIAKGTAYSYFSSKEALFLAVLQHELTQWLDHVGTFVSELSASVSSTAEQLAAEMAHSLSRRPHLLNLLGKLHHQLENNVTLAEIGEFKRFLLNRIGVMSPAIEQACGLQEGDGTKLFLRAHALAIGVGQVAQPTTIVTQLIEQAPEFSALHIEFEEEFTVLLNAVLQSMAHQARR